MVILWVPFLFGRCCKRFTELTLGVPTKMNWKTIAIAAAVAVVAVALLARSAKTRAYLLGA